MKLNLKNGKQIDDVIESFPNAVTLENFLKNGLRKYKSPENFETRSQRQSSARTLGILYILLAALHPKSIEVRDSKPEKNRLAEIIQGIDDRTSLEPITACLPPAFRLYRYEGHYPFKGSDFGYFASKYKSWDEEKKQAFKKALRTNTSAIEEYTNELHFDFDGVVVSENSHSMDDPVYQIFDAHVWEQMAFKIFPQSDVEKIESKEHRRYWERSEEDFFDPKLKKQTLAIALAEQFLSFPWRHRDNFTIGKPLTAFLEWVDFKGQRILVVAKKMQTPKFALESEDEEDWSYYIDRVFEDRATVDFFSEASGVDGPGRKRTASIVLPLTPTDRKLANYLLNSWDY